MAYIWQDEDTGGLIRGLHIIYSKVNVSKQSHETLKPTHNLSLGVPAHGLKAHHCVEAHAKTLGGYIDSLCR